MDESLIEKQNGNFANTVLVAVHSKPKCLDLFCCAGGAGRGYADAGFEVIGVDLRPQPNYPFTFHQADVCDLPRYFLAAFESGNLAADLDNGSGTGTPDNGVDINDLLYFLAGFEAGSGAVDLDNDGDGVKDCADPDCVRAPRCAGGMCGAEACRNGVDDDCDGTRDNGLPFQDFFVDTDGKKGLSGKVVTRAGASLARAFIAGTISGISHSVGLR